MRVMFIVVRVTVLFECWPDGDFYENLIILTSNRDVRTLVAPNQLHRVEEVFIHSGY